MPEFWPNLAEIENREKSEFLWSGKLDTLCKGSRWKLHEDLTASGPPSSAYCLLIGIPVFSFELRGVENLKSFRSVFGKLGTDWLFYCPSGLKKLFFIINWLNDSFAFHAEKLRSFDKKIQLPPMSKWFHSRLYCVSRKLDFNRSHLGMVWPYVTCL